MYCELGSGWFSLDVLLEVPANKVKKKNKQTNKNKKT